MYIQLDKTVLTAQIRTDYLTNNKGPRFSSPLTPAQHSAHNYFTIYESRRTFHICSSFKDSGERQQNHELLPSTKTLVHAPMGENACCLHVSPSHQIQAGEETHNRLADTCLWTKQKQLSLWFPFHCASALCCRKNNTNESEVWRGIQMGMHRETGGIQ